MSTEKRTYTSSVLYFNKEERLVSKKYVVFPGYIVSKYDGDEHYISANEIINLYGVNPSDCIIVRYSDQEDFKPIESQVVLRPDHSGRYELAERGNR